MKRSFQLITILILLSVVGIILIQYSWLKNVILIKDEQVRDRVDMVEYEVVESLVTDLGTAAPALPLEALPKNPTEQILSMLTSPTASGTFSVAEVEKRFRDAFAANKLKDVKFEFAIMSSKNDQAPAISSTDFDIQYSLAEKDTANFMIAVWPLVSLTSGVQNIDPEEKIVVVVSGVKSYVLKSIGWMIAAAILFSLIIISAFYVTVRTILTQKKLSEMKTDFINNMTHELRTPLATISIAVDTLKNDKVIGDKEKISSIGGIIKTENNRMNLQVEQILQAAQLDINQVLKEKEELYVNNIIKKINDKFSLQVEEKDATLVLDLKAENDLVMGHPIHFMNMFSNLIDNALKYSREDVPPQICIRTKNVKNRIVVSIEDNGIGMDKETQSHVFDKFYRAHTGNIHNVKGFGLGLNYTRKMVEAHDGTILVDSKVGYGSTFTVSLPIV